MSGGKGTSSTPVKNTTESTNPLAKYVTGAAEYLSPIAQDPSRPYTAPPDPRQTAGYDYLSNTGANLGGWPTAKQYDAYGNLITGGGTSPAQPGYAQFAAGQAGPQQTADQVVDNSYNRANVFATGLQNLAGVAGANSNLGLTELGNFASGGYDANPYLPAAIAAAQRPVQLAYQESTAPTTDARFSGGGRYGSGANDAARVRDETALAGSLGDISTNMSYADFKAAMDRKLAAAGTYGQQFNTGLSTAGNLLGAGGNLIDQSLRTALGAADLNQRGELSGLSGLDTGFRAGLTTQEQALRDYNNFAAGQMIPGNADIQAGTGARDLATSVNREPYDRVNAFLKSISGAGPNAAGTSGSTTTPYFSNDIASGLSAASGVLGLGKQLGIGDLFSSGAGGAGSFSTLANAGLSDFGGGGLGALSTGFAPALSAADYALPALGGTAASSAGKGASSFLPAFLIP